MDNRQDNDHNVSFLIESTEEGEDIFLELESDEDYWQSDGHSDTRQIYFQQLRFSKIFTVEEEQATGYLVAKGDQLARQKFIESNLRLVVKTANRYRNRGVLQSDLISEGNIGLIRAVDKFDVNLGFRFSTYAICWIRQFMENALLNQLRNVRLPIHLAKELKLTIKARHRLSQQLGREPSLEEFAAFIEKQPQLLRRLLNLDQSELSLEATSLREGDFSLKETLVDEQEDLVKTLHEERVNSQLMNFLNMLNVRQREILCRRYGLDGFEVETLEVIADQIGVSRERVRQLQLAGLKNLKKIFENQGVEAENLFG